MRRARIAGDPGAAANCHHLMSRVIEGRFIFDRVVKEKFREFLEAHCAFGYTGNGRFLQSIEKYESC